MLCLLMDKYIEIQSLPLVVSILIHKRKWYDVIGTRDLANTHVGHEITNNSSLNEWQRLLAYIYMSLYGYS